MQYENRRVIHLFAFFEKQSVKIESIQSHEAPLRNNKLETINIILVQRPLPKLQLITCLAEDLRFSFVPAGCKTRRSYWK